MCIALLLLVRDLCLELDVVILASAFNRGEEREAAASGSMDQRGFLVGEGSGLVTSNSLKVNFYTFERDDFTCTPIQVPGSLRYFSWAVEGMVVIGKFRWPPGQSCSYFTIAK